MKPSNKAFVEIFDHFDDSDFDELESLDGCELDDVNLNDPLYDIDPLQIENSSDDYDHHNENEFTEKGKVNWKRQPFISKMIRFEQEISDPYIDPEDNLKSPLEYFKSYFKDEIFEQFASYTNEYAKQQNVKSFQDTNPSEMKVLFGLHMLMGIIKLPRIRMYWSPLINIDNFKTNMSCDRFFQLRNNLHIVNNLEKPNDCIDKLYKVRPVIDAVRNRLLQFEVCEVLSIDEQIIPFEGRLVVKQYVKDKPIPWGVKVFVLCGKNGLPYDFFGYQGSSTELSPINLKQFGFCASVVLHLVNRLDRRGHQLYYDNYFSSYQLLEILKERGINAGGTIRINRFSKPPLLSDKEMAKKGRGYSDSVVSENDQVVVVKWQDNKCVHMGSNFVGIGTSDKAKRWDKKLKRKIDVTRPEIISLYNSGMGGVDLLDQLISYYRIFIRSRKWPLRLIFHFVDFAVCSSWKEYRHDREKANVPKKKMKDLLHFRMELAFSLIKVSNTVQKVKRGRPKLSTIDDERSIPLKRCKVIQSHEVRPYNDIRFDRIDHLPKHDQKNNPTRCKQNKCDGRTFFLCEKCNVHLCISKTKNCFYEFHLNKSS